MSGETHVVHQNKSQNTGRKSVMLHDIFIPIPEQGVEKENGSLGLCGAHA